MIVIKPPAALGYYAQRPRSCSLLFTFSRLLVSQEKVSLKRGGRCVLGLGAYYLLMLNATRGAYRAGILRSRPALDQFILFLQII